MLSTREDIQQQYEALFEEHENCSHIVRQRESQIQILAAENERLIKIKLEFEQEMENLRNQMNEFEGLIQNKDQETESEMSQLKKRIESLTEELDESKGYGKTVEQKLKECESIIVQLQEENGKIGQQFEEKELTIAELRNKLALNGSKSENVQTDLENKIRMLATENERLTDLLETAKVESANNHQYRIKLQEAQDKLHLLASENERLQTIVKEKMGKQDALVKAKNSLEADLEDLLSESKKYKQ